MRGLELVVSSAGYDFPHLSKLARDVNHGMSPTRVSIMSGRYGIAVFDITLTEQNEIRLIEVNGSNAGLTSIFDNDVARSRHMWTTFSQKPPTQSAVVILPFKPGFMHLPEFFGRATAFASLISRQRSTAMRSAEEDLGAEDVSVVCGSIPVIAAHMHACEDELYYRNRIISFACNPNILAEIKRREVIHFDAEIYRIGEELFHDGPFVRLIHDKGMQQDIADGTGITPLYHEEAQTIDDAFNVIQRFHQRGLVAVGKINAGSGGAGISFFPTGQPVAETKKELSAMIASALQHYGKGAERTLFPLRFFEFARSTDFALADGPHLWDMRMLCLVSPEFVEVIPCVIRICPESFDGRNYSRESVVSNLSDRPPSLRFIRAAMDLSALSAIGMTPANLRRVVHACAMWCGKAAILGTST